MALPQQVVEQLNQGSERTPGWSSGIILFSGSILFIILFIYAGLRFGYEAYLNAQISSLNGQAQKMGQSVSASDEASLVTFYSQISNLESLVKGHVFFSQFLTWLERNTEVNVNYTSMSFAAGNQVTLAGMAKTSADVSEQMAVFEADPSVSLVSLSNLTFSPTANEWTFNLVLTMQQSVFLWNESLSSPVGALVPSPATTTPAGAGNAAVPGIATTTPTTTP
jgi:hypothetical protein